MNITLSHTIESAVHSLSSTELVTNGDFHDFTMDDDEHVKGHWIFDSVYNTAEGGGGYVGEDWSQGGVILGGEVVSNGDFNDDSNWNANDPNITIENGKAVFNAPASWKSLTQTSVFTTGQYYLISVEVTDLVHGYLICGVDGDWVINSNGIHTRIIKADRAKLIFFAISSAILKLDNVSVKAASNGNHLLPYKDFDITNQMGGSNPAYENGNALEFDGVDDYFYIPAAQAEAFNPGSGNFTIEAWVRNSSNGEVDTIINKGEDDVDGYELNWTTDNAIRLSVYNIATSSSVTAKSGAGYRDGNWHYIAAKRDGDNISIQVDNDNPVIVSGAEGININNSHDMIIGRHEGTSYYYNDFMSEIRYSNIARTAKEIKESYARAKNWIWDGAGDIQNSNFQQVVSGGGEVTQTVTGLDSSETYRENIDEAETNITGVTSHELTLTDGTHASASLKEIELYQETNKLTHTISRQTITTVI